jgi:cytochrome oxidase Cu insertion factor (SCO1/SenC/PrrC family)
VNKTSKAKLHSARVPTNRFSWWPYALSGAVLVAITAFLIVTHGGSNSPSSTVGSVGDRGLHLGAMVPVMSLESTDGTAVSLDQLRGSKIVLYFYESSS